MKMLLAMLLVVVAYAPRLEAGIVYTWEATCSSRSYVTLEPFVRTDLPCPAVVRGTLTMADSYLPGTPFDFDHQELQRDQVDLGFVLFDEFFEEGFASMRPAEARRGSLPAVEGAGNYLEYSDAPAKIEITPESWRFLAAVHLGCPCFVAEGGTSVFRRISEPPALALLLAGALCPVLAIGSRRVCAAARQCARRCASPRSAAP